MGHDNVESPKPGVEREVQVSSDVVSTFVQQEHIVESKKQENEDFP
jgi:hypothetical protein